MPATVVATKIGTNTSAVRGTIACTAGATSLDILTVNHALGACPHLIVTTLRTVVVAASLTGAGLTLLSWDATKATFLQNIAPGGGATSALHDIVFQKTHTMVR